MFLSGYKGKDRDDEAGSCREIICKNLNTENATQNICLLDYQVLMLMENRGHKLYSL
jgi:hypothetical protein